MKKGYYIQLTDEHVKENGLEKHFLFFKDEKTMLDVLKYGVPSSAVFDFGPTVIFED